MTNDKARQSFEAYFGETDDDTYSKIQALLKQLAFTNYQAGRAAERAEIVAKLESAGVVDEIGKSVYAASPAHIYGTTITVPWDEAAPPYREDAIREAKAAIIKILEVI
jgi:hypothetical protein